MIRRAQQFGVAIPARHYTPKRWRCCTVPATSAYAGMTPSGLSAVAVSWIHGYAVQAMIDPEFDTDEYPAAVRGLIGQLS